MTRSDRRQAEIHARHALWCHHTPLNEIMVHWLDTSAERYTAF